VERQPPIIQDALCKIGAPGLGVFAQPGLEVPILGVRPESLFDVEPFPQLLYLFFKGCNAGLWRLLLWWPRFCSMGALPARVITVQTLAVALYPGDWSPTLWGKASSCGCVLLLYRVDHHDWVSFVAMVNCDNRMSRLYHDFTRIDNIDKVGRDIRLLSINRNRSLLRLGVTHLLPCLFKRGQVLSRIELRLQMGKIERV
jgi:hypothetical protein